MDSPTVISPSQLLLDEIHKFFDAFNRKFDEIDARWERRLAESRAARAQRVAAVEPRVDIPAVVVTDNWGGLFEEPAHISEVRDLPLSDASVVADNWGGQFEQRDASSPPASLLAEDNLKPASFAPLQPQADEAGSTDSAPAAPPPTLGEPSPLPSVHDDAAGVVPSGTGDDFGLPQDAKVLATLGYYEMASSASLLDDSDGLLRPPSFPSGRVCAGLVHTRACASSTVALGRGSPAGWYESDTDGSLRPPSSGTATPASSIRNDDEIPNQLHHANQIDSPGHADLYSAVSAASRISDSALIVIDAAKGVRVQTHAAFAELLLVAGLPSTTTQLPHSPGSASRPAMDAYIIAFDLDPRDADPERACAIFAFESFRLGRATPLGAYDGSLDDDPESGFAHLDAPLEPAIARVGQAVAAAAALRGSAPML